MGVGSEVIEVAGTPGVGTHPVDPGAPGWDAGTPGPETGVRYIFGACQRVGNSTPAPRLAEESLD